MWGIIVAIVTVFAVARFYTWTVRRKLKTPPRVPGLPLLGNVLQLKAPAIHHGLSECAKKHGNIYTISLMGSEIVVLNSSELMREACVVKGNDFADRIPTTYIIKTITYHGNEIFFGPMTKELVLLRKTMHASIKTYGEEGTHIQELIQDELQLLVDNYERTEGVAVNPQPELRTALTNIITCLLIGRNTDRNAAEARNIDTMVNELVILLTPGYGAELDFFPFLRWFPVESVRCLRRYMTARDAVLGPMYEEAKANFDPNVQKSFVDMLIQAGQCHAKFSEENILGAMTALFIAGVVTTFSTVSSLMLICLHRPDVQKKLHEEIDREIGHCQRPALHHRPGMHFLNATLLEVLRYVSVGAITLRNAARDSTIGGYDIEKGTMVLLNIWEAHHNSEWQDPWHFRPERFLDENGELLPTNHPERARLLPFGAGSRSCAGEVFARSRMFLFIATLWQRFSFLPIPGENLPSCDPREFMTAAAVVPPAFQCKITKRT